MIFPIFLINYSYAQVTFEKNYYKNYYLNGHENNNITPAIINTIDSGYFIISVGGDTDASNNCITSVCRLNKQGNILWSKNSDPYTLYQDAGLSEIVQYQDSSLVIPWNDQTFGGAYPRTGFIHIDKNGNPLWGKKYICPPNEGYIYMNSIARTYNKGLIGYGTIIPYTSSLDFNFFLKTDSAGNIQWCKQYFPDSSSGYSTIEIPRIALAPDSGFLLTFAAHDSISGTGYGYLMKTDANGNVQWAKRYNPGICIPVFTKPQINNNSIILPLLYTTFSNVAVLKTTMQGIPISNFAYTGSDINFFYDGVTDNNGNTLLSGVTNETLGFIFKIDSSGNILWSYKYGEPDSTIITNLLLTLDGGILGYSSGPFFLLSQSPLNLVKTNASGNDGCEQPFPVNKTALPLVWQSVRMKTYSVAMTQKDTILNFSFAPIDTTTLCAVKPITKPIAKIYEQKDTVCNDYCLCFTDSTQNGPSAWNWQFMGANPNSSNAENPCGICYPAPGKYRVMLIASNVGGSDTTYDSVIVIPQPVISISGRDSICPGDSTKLIATPENLHVLWSTGSTNDSIGVTPATNTYYTVQTSNAYCTVKDSVHVIIAIPKATICCDTTISQGQSVQLNVSGGSSYKWNPPIGLSCDSCNNPIASPFQKTTYNVTVTNDIGCISMGIIIIDVACGEIFIPSAFSPNEAHNNILYVRGTCIATMDFLVFDRWGNKVFESQNLNNGWDGTYNGQPMNMATYVWYLKATLNDGISIEKKGNVTLVR